MNDRVLSLSFPEKQREFYKNAKHVTKYRKSLKQQSQKSELSLAIRPYEVGFDVCIVLFF